MKQINNSIVILLCISVIGFFANFAQNDYGMQIVAYSLLGVGALLLLLAFKELQYFKKVGLFLFSLIILPLFLEIISAKYFPDFASLFFFLALILIITLFPLSVFIAERKKANKTNFTAYFEFTFLAFLCLGNYLKLFHLTGAGPIIVLSVLIFIPIIWNLFKQKKGFLKSNEGVFYLISSLQIVLCIIGFAFKIQHWPWANYFIFSSLILLGITILMFSIFLFTVGINLFKPLSFARRISVGALGIMLLFFLLRINGLGPKIYSNEFPNTFYQLSEKANEITVEGKIYQRKANTYITYYKEFIEAQKEK